jgi:catalase (peroxidase I)
VDIRSNYSRLGLNDEEIVALFGYRTLGFLSNKGDHEILRWTRNPYIFDNNYYVELLDSMSPYVKTESDLALINDDSFRKIVELYSKDQSVFFEKFAITYEKISEINHKDLMIEF